MKYLPVFTLRVTHSYYAGLRCPDFRIDPAPATERLLKNHRCVVKSLPDGIRVLTALDDAGKPFIAFPEDVTFGFHLRLQNPDFALFTDLSDLNDQPAPVYTNVDLSPGASNELRLDSLTAWFTERLVVVQPSSEEHFTLSGRPMAGVELGHFEIEGSAQVTLKGYAAARRVMAVDSHLAGQGETFAIKYPIQPRLERGVFADVEIHHNATLHPISDGPVEFTIAFSAKQARWIYYFVTDLKGSEGELKIVDADPSLALVFSDKNRRDLVNNPDPTDNLAEELAEKYPENQRFRFVSEDLIPCRQEARKHLELHLDGNRLYAILPNPSLRNHGKMDVKEGESLDQQETLYQVVKYLSHPFPSKGV